MDLAEHQRKIRGLIKASYDGSHDDDPYIRRVAGSDGLSLIREISAWWRMVGIEKSSVLTPRLLKHLGIFEATVEEFVDGWAISPFVEHAAHAFLEAMGRHPDPLVAAVARFELALIRVKQGDQNRVCIDWPCDPDPVLSCLLEERPLPPPVVRPVWHRVIVSPDLQDLFVVEAPDAPSG